MNDILTAGDTWCVRVFDDEAIIYQLKTKIFEFHFVTYFYNFIDIVVLGTKAAKPSKQ